MPLSWLLIALRDLSDVEPGDHVGVVALRFGLVDAAAGADSGEVAVAAVFEAVVELVLLDTDPLQTEIAFAFAADPDTGVYVDHRKVHKIDFEGEHFRSRGPLNTVRSPQGYPVLCQAGASERGREFSSKNAEVVLGMMTGGVAGMKAYREDIRARAEAQGRDPDDIKVVFLTPVNILPEGVEQQEMTEAEKQASFEHNIVMASSSLDVDFSLYDLDVPVPQDIVAGGHTSALDHMKKAGREEGKSIRDLFSAGQGASGMDFSGTVQQVADKLMAVMDEVGGDGFLIEGSGYNRQLPDLVNGVIPALQKAGAVRTEYTGTTLREILQEF